MHLFFLFYRKYDGWILTTYQPPTDHLPITNWPPTDHLPTTYQPRTDHVPTTHRPPTDHLPTTYRPPIDHLPTTYRPPTNHLPTTYWPPTDHFYSAACSIFPPFSFLHQETLHLLLNKHSAVLPWWLLLLLKLVSWAVDRVDIKLNLQMEAPSNQNHKR